MLCIDVAASFELNVVAVSMVSFWARTFSSTSNHVVKETTICQQLFVLVH